MIDTATVFRIGELNRLARQALEREFPLCWVSGEVSNLTRAASGHVYFTLKDESAQARCVMFRSRAQSLPWRLENGQQVEARVLVSLYEPRGDFQLNVEALRRAGLGRLFEAFARLKQQLETEGLFAPARKRPLPRYPRTLGIVSSPQAAALRDVLVALRRRAPNVRAILYPTPVQGEGAAASIAAAIATADARDECDALLLVRGGGSIEDLWSFNEEIVARAVAACRRPIICGVGHETDVTIADFAADLRAPTPTAAAELATQGWFDAEAELAGLGLALREAMADRLARAQQGLDHLALRLIHPAQRLSRSRDRLALLSTRLAGALSKESRRQRERLERASRRLERGAPRTEAHHGHLALLAQRLQAATRREMAHRANAVSTLTAALTHLNPQATLERGFAIVRDEEGRILTDAAALPAGAMATLDLARGHARVRVVDSAPDSRLE